MIYFFIILLISGNLLYWYGKKQETIHYQEIRDAQIPLNNKINQLTIPVYQTMIKNWVAPCPRCGVNTVIHEYKDVRLRHDRSKSFDYHDWTTYEETEYTITRFCENCSEDIKYPAMISETFPVLDGPIGGAVFFRDSQSTEGYMWRKAVMESMRLSSGNDLQPEKNSSHSRQALLNEEWKNQKMMTIYLGRFISLVGGILVLLSFLDFI